jgi:hypothetical protein
MDGCAADCGKEKEQKELFIRGCRHLSSLKILRDLVYPMSRLDATNQFCVRDRPEKPERKETEFDAEPGQKAVPNFR